MGWPALECGTWRQCWRHRAAVGGGRSRRETIDDLVRDMIEVPTSMCARFYGRRGARDQAMRAVTATRR